MFLWHEFNIGFEKIEFVAKQKKMLTFVTKILIDIFLCLVLIPTIFNLIPSISQYINFMFYMEQHEIYFNIFKKYLFTNFVTK